MKRYAIFFTFAICINYTGGAQSTVSIKTGKTLAVEVLRQIEMQTGYTFSYNPALLKNFPPVSVQLENVSLNTALNAIFGKSDVQFIVQNKHVILKKRPKNIVVSGFIYDCESHESLLAATIYDENSQQGAVSNNYGFYSLSLPPGDIRLRPSYVGYQSKNAHFTADKDTVVHFYLQPSSLLKEVVVQGKLTDPVESVDIGKLNLNAQTIKSIPSFLGESDVVKALQQLPGVAVGTDGMAGMYVRGGNSDENLYLVDGNPLYHINHLLGLFSTFNPEAVKTLDFYKGSFPARYGGRLSSVVDVRMNDGDMKKFSGMASIGLISSRFNFQGPIVKDKTSFTVSLRRTYLDIPLRVGTYFYNKNEKKNNPNDYISTDFGYYFYDFNAKINHKFSDKSRLFLSLYDGRDKLFYNQENLFVYAEEGVSLSSGDGLAASQRLDNAKTDITWGTRMSSLNWACNLNSKLFLNATLVYSRYMSKISMLSEATETYNIGDDPEKEASKKYSYSKSAYNSGITDSGYRLNFDFAINNNHLLRFGTALLHHRFRPEESYIRYKAEKESEEPTDEIITFADEHVGVEEFSLYAEDEMDLSGKLKMNAGIHWSGFFVQGKSYLSLQPRISARYLLSGNLSLKVSYGKMNQYVHLLQSNLINMPTDLWVPITKQIKPMISHQASAGIFGKYKSFDYSAEAYYKKSENQIEYVDGASVFADNLNWEGRVAQGNAMSYGVELMARKSFGKTSGWMGYTLSWTNRHFPGGEINQGKVYPSKYDNRHKINLVLMHKFNEKFDLNLSWIYSTGNWATLPTEKYIDINGEEQDYYEKRNNYKLPDYQRLDLGLNYYRKKKNGRMGIWNLSIYNVYSYHNSFLISPKIRYYEDPATRISSSQPIYSSWSIFPILPSFSYTYQF